MARIPYCNFKDLDQKERDFFERLPGGLNIFKMLAHAGQVGRDCVRLGASILYAGKVQPDLRELAIIRTGIVCGSGYEVHQHIKVARQIGISDEKIEALYKGSSAPAFSQLESLVIRFAEEFVQNNRVTPETFSGLLGHFSHQQITELSIAIGYYRLISSFLETFEVDIEK